MNYHITSHKKMSRQSILSWAGSFVIHGLMVFLALELMTHVTPAPSSKPLQWNVSLMNPLPTPQPPQPTETVKQVTPTHRAAISRPQPKTQVTQHRRRTRQTPTHQHVTAKAYTPQRALPKSVPQATAQRSPLRQVTKDAQQHIQQTVSTKTRYEKSTQGTATTLNTVRLQNNIKQQMPVVTSPSGFKTQTHTTSTKSVSQSVKTSSPVQHSQSNRSDSMSRPEPKQKNLHAAIYAGKPDSQPARRISTKSKPISTSKHKVTSRPQSSRNTRVASNKLSPEVLAFLKLLRDKIQRYREYPRVAKRLGYHGVTTVAFALSQGGNLTLLQVSEPSGHDILDQAALDAIKKVMPLKPPSMMGNAAIEIPVSFELRH